MQVLVCKALALDYGHVRAERTRTAATTFIH